MQIRWAPAAADDLQQIFDYIRLDNSQAAQDVVQAIFDRAEALAAHPYQGRRGRVDGTREVALPPLPFVVIYRILETAGAIEIVNVIHGAQRWPPPA